jgi:hypothetical protein
MRKVENEVYPVLIGEAGFYPDVWSFKSLYAHLILLYSPKNVRTSA